MLQTLLVYCGVMLLMFSFAQISAMRMKTVHSVRNIPFWTWENIFLIAVFVVFFGLRYDVGVDHLNYLEGYLTGNRIERTEPIFLGITNFLRDKGVHFFVYFALLAFLQIFFVLYSIRDERYLYPFLILSLFMGQFFWHWMNAIRQDIAACIYVFSVQFIVNKKFAKFLITILLAIGFHRASIILIVTYPLLCGGKDLSMKRFFQLSLLVIIGLLTITHFDVLTRVLPMIHDLTDILEYVGYARYSESRLVNLGERTSWGIGLYVFMILDALIILQSDQLKAYYNNKRFIIYYNLYYWGMILQLFLMNNLVLARPVRFFRVFKLLMIAYYLNYLYKQGSSSKGLFLFLCSMGLLAILFVSIIVNEPYYFFFGKI